MPWFSTNRRNILAGDGNVLLDSGERHLEGVTTYESTPGIYRDFCGQCGAKLLYYSDKREGGAVADIACGLLNEHLEGARAERWMFWHERVTLAADAINNLKEVLTTLEEGLVLCW